MDSSSDGKSLAGWRILIVEDDWMLADAIVDLVERSGAKPVGPFSTTIAALQGMAQFDAIDLAILDIRLGDQTSYPLAEALQTTGIPFLFLTATSRSDMPSRFDRIAHVLKPHSEAELVKELVKLGGP